jgi:hypothetical protein
MSLLRIPSAAASLLVSLGAFPLSLAGKERYAGWIWNVLFPTLQRVGPLQRLAMGAGNIQAELQVAGASPEEILARIPNADDEEISVLFSGGGDSTLLAFLLAQRFRKVHLLTCRHLGVKEPEKTAINANRLIEMFGADRISRTVLDVDVPLRRLYEHDRARNLRDFGLLAQNVCGVCKMTMFASSIPYNHARGIRYTATGSHMEGAGVFIGQMKSVREQVFEPLFRRYGMEFLTPVFYVPNSDERLFELGVTKKRKTKFPQDNTTYQAWCNFSVLQNIYARGYYMQVRSQAEHERRSLAYAQRKVAPLTAWIDEQIAAQADG